MATGVSGSGSNCNSGGGELMKAVVVNETTGEIEYIEDYVEIPDNSGVSHEVEVVSVDDFRRRLRNHIVHPHQNSTSTTQSIVKPLVSTLSSPPSGAGGGGGSGGSGSFQVQLRNTPSLLRNSRAAARNLGQAHHGHVQSQIPAVPVPVQLPVQIQSQSQQQQQLNQLQIQQQLQLQQVQHQTQQAIQQIFEFLPVIQQGGGQGLNSIQSIQLSSPSVLPPASAQFLRTFETGSGGSSNNVNLNLDSSTINQLIVYNCGDNQYELLPGQDSILDNGSGSVQLRLCEVIQTEGGDHEIVEGISVLGEDGSTQFQTADGNTIYICSEPQEGDEDDSGEHEHQTYAVPVEDVEEYEGIQIVDHDMPILQDEDGNIYEVQGGHESLEMEFPVPMPIPNKRRKKMGGPARTLGANAAARVMAGKSDSKASSISSSHVPVSLKVPKKPLNELKCLETGCPFAGVNVSELRKHLCAVHFFTFDEEVIMFPSDKDFKSWRETYERERMVSFIFRGGTKKISRDQAVTYLICHRSGHYKPTMKDQSLRKRKMKPQGSCKMNGYCTAGIKLLKNLESGEVRCEICHTHYGHPLDNGAIPHLRVNNILRKIIRKKFEEGMSFNQVVQYLHHNPDHLEGLRLLDRRAVRNIYDKFRKNPKEFFDEDSNEIDHLFEHDLDIKSPVDSDGDDIGNDSLTITSIQDSEDTGPPKSSFVLHVIDEPAATSPTVEDQDMDIKPSMSNPGKIGLRLFRPSQELKDVEDKEELEISSKSEQILPDNGNSESGIVSVSNSDSNLISGDTKILNSIDERKNLSRKNSVSSEESIVRKSRSRSTNESNDESIRESIDAVVNNIQTNYEHEATTSPQPESLAKLSPVPEIESPISPKKRGRKPKGAKTSADNLNNSLSETETSMGDTPRRSGRERKPKLFHDDQEYDARFHGVKIKVETEPPGSTSSTSIASSEKEKEVKIILPPSSPKKKSITKTKESAPKSPTKLKHQSIINSNIASHHLVSLTLEPPTLEKHEISVPSKIGDSNNDVPSPSESISTDGDNLPPILKSIVDQEANENSTDKSNSQPPSLSPFPASETAGQTESEGKLQPYNQVQDPEYSGPILSATVSSSSSLSPVKTGVGKNKKNTAPSRKSQNQSEEKQLDNSKTANPKPKPKPKSILVKSEPSLNTAPNSVIGRRKPKETAPKVVAPPAEIISEELKSTIQGMLKHGESGPTVLLYKIPGTLTPECGRKDSRIHKDDFILVIQTPVQRQLMQMFSDVINIDGHKGRPKDLKLMWVIVLDEFREAIPVAWLISNSTEPRMVSIFLRVLHAQCGDIQTNYLMAPLCTGNEYCSLWASVFKPPNQKVGGSGLPQLILNEEETKRDMRIEVAETFPDTLSRRKLNTCMNQLMWAVSKRQFEAAYKEMKNFLESQHEEKGLIFFRNFERNWIHRANEWNLLHRIGSPVNTLYASDSFGKLKKFIAFKGTRILNSCIDPVLKIGYDKCFSRSKRIFKGDQKLLRTMEEIEMQHGWGTEIDPDNFVLIRNEGENQAHTEEDGNGNCESPESEYLKFRFCVKDPEKNAEYFVFNTQCPCRCKYICSKCEICIHQFICTCPLSAVEHQMCSHIHFVQIMTQIQQSQSQKSVALFASSNPIIHDQQVYHIQLDNMDVSIQEEDDGQSHDLLPVGESENISDNEQNENMDNENEDCDVPTTVSENESECEVKNETQEVEMENEDSSNQVDMVEELQKEIPEEEVQEENE